jgi:hypothetical protein
MLGKLLAAITKKKAAKLFEEEKQRIDENWPLRIKLGCTIEIESTPFLVAGDALKIACPPMDNIVKAAGKSVFNNGEIVIYRFYLNEAGASEEESMLQLSFDKKGELFDLMLYRLSDEIRPASDADWDIWLNKYRGLIGYTNFQIDPGTPQVITYERVTPDGSGERLNPLFIRESITDDPYVESIITVDHALAVYGRGVTLEGDVIENILISKDDDETDAVVRIWIGIPLDAGFIKIL